MGALVFALKSTMGGLVFALKSRAQLPSAKPSYFSGHFRADVYASFICRWIFGAFKTRVQIPSDTSFLFFFEKFTADAHESVIDCRTMCIIICVHV